MAHLWMHETASGEWVQRPLTDGAVGPSPAALLRRAGADPDVWVVLGPAAVHVNGVPLDTGIRVLRDRDELRVADRRLFFSTESLAEVVPFPGSDRPVFCPRCKLEIAPGSLAVCCPQCRVWHHQSDEFPCWTYAETCTMCDQPSALDTGFRWTPEGL